jgi:hypothetical protein
MRRHPRQPDFDAIACKFIALAIRGNIRPGSQVWLTTYFVDDEGKTLPPVRKDLLATLRVAQPWLTARELFDNVTSFLAHWIPNTHCVPLAGYGSQNQVALVVDYALEIVNPERARH